MERDNGYGNQRDDDVVTAAGHGQRQRLLSRKQGCVMYGISYWTVAQCMAADKRLYAYGVQIGFGTKRRTRRYTADDFLAMLREIGRRGRMS